MNTGYLKDRFCEPGEVLIPVDSIGLNRGYAAFDFLKIVKQQPFYGERHLQRFFNTMKLLRIEIAQSEEEVMRVVQTIANRSKHPYFGLKLFAVPVDNLDPERMRGELCIIPVVLPLLPESAFTKGSKLITFEYARFLPEAKSTHYLPSVYWEPEVQKQGALEPLFCSAGNVLETARSNVFVCKNGEVFTPENQVLKGITRSVIVDLLTTSATPLYLQDVSYQQLLDADEVFITSTTKGAAPIVKVNDKIIGDGTVGPITRRLIEAYQSLIAN